ncbi:hypothetical protein U0070_013057 [Myodes glareolus]|uniref:Ribosomal RNA-processing protein 43 n=1 Tax=Myodes glareolus TaxID=447135 RepID=A0AAW0IVZ8_MYOGA
MFVRARAGVGVNGGCDRTDPASPSGLVVRRRSWDARAPQLLFTPRSREHSSLHRSLLHPGLLRVACAGRRRGGLRRRGAGGKMAAGFKTVEPLEYYRRFLKENCRPDGRELGEFRTTTVNIGSISTADGSALVKLGNTTVVCGVKAVGLLVSGDCPVPN